jgi:soluble lytic murein transglycosylase-like protein
MRNSWLFILIGLAPGVGYSACFDEAAARYGLPVTLLKAISRVESSGRPNAINRNSNGTYDIGHMQVNTGWLPTLERFGINEQKLFDVCTNTYVGAWILAQNISKLGYSWDAIGAYNAVSPRKRSAYAQKIAAVLRLDGAL